MAWRPAVQTATISKGSKPALRAGFDNTGTSPKQRCQIGINQRRAIDSRQIRRCLKTRKNGVGVLASRYRFLAVTSWNVARPIPDVLAVRAILHPQKNRGVSVLVLSDLSRPENFHEIARLRLIEIIEVPPQLQFVKKTGSARPVRVPAAPDSFAIALIPNDQLFERGIVQMNLASRAQSLDCSDEHEIGRARAETWARRQNEKFARFKMRRSLQADLCEMRDRITAALRHLFNLIKNQGVAVFSDRCPQREPNKRQHNPHDTILHGA